MDRTAVYIQGREFGDALLPSQVQSNSRTRLWCAVCRGSPASLPKTKYTRFISIYNTSFVYCRHGTQPQGPVQFYIIPYPLPIYSKTDKGAIGSNTCHLPEAVTSVSHGRMTNNLQHFVQK